MRHKMNTVVQLTGLKSELLRSWERRHQLLTPARTKGGHRLYSDDDVAVLHEVRRLLAEGRSIGAIASEGREALLSAVRRRQSVPAVPAAPRGPGPRPLTEPERRSARADLVRAAVQVDPDRFFRALHALREVGNPRDYVPGVLIPVAVRLGELWREGVCSVAGEHLASSALGGWLVELLGQELARPDAGSGLHIACAGVPGERHANPGLFWSLEKAWEGHRVSWLGVDLPFADLDDACEHLAPDEIHLSVTRSETLRACRPALDAFERRWSGRARVRVGGAAWVDGGEAGAGHAGPRSSATRRDRAQASSSEVPVEPLDG